MAIEKNAIETKVEAFIEKLSTLKDLQENIKKMFITVYRVLLIVIALLQKLKEHSTNVKNAIESIKTKGIITSKEPKIIADEHFKPMTYSNLQTYIDNLSKILDYYENRIIAKFGNPSKNIQKPDGFQSIHFISSKNKTVVSATWARLDGSQGSSIESKSDRFAEFDPRLLVSEGIKIVDDNQKLYTKLKDSKLNDYLDIIDILADVYNVIIRHLMFIDYSYKQYIKVPTDLKPPKTFDITNGMSQISSEISSYNLIFLQLINSLLESGISKKRREEEELKQKAELDRLLKEINDQFEKLIAAFELEKNKFLERYNSVNDERLKTDIIAQNAEIKSVVELCNSNKYKEKQITNPESKEALFLEIKQDTAAIIKGLTAFNNAYINILEDKKGAVRVYVKVKYDNGDLGGIKIDKYDGNAKNSNTNVRKRDQNVMSQVDQNADNYILKVENKTFITNNVFNGFINLDIARKAVGMDAINKAIDEENRIVYEQQCKGLFKQVLDGYSIVFFGYGFSGSGKTTILLGNGNNRGIVQYGFMDDEFINNVEQIQVANIFELYVNIQHNNNLKLNDNDDFKFVNKPLNKCRGVIINSNYRDIMNTYDNVLFSKDQQSHIITQNITTLLNELAKTRLLSKRIVPTTNNPESSRSHLFIVFKIITKDKKEGHVTVCDLGGSEDPVQIMRQYAREIFDTKNISSVSFNGFQGYKNKTESMEKYLKKMESLNKTYVQEVLPTFKSKKPVFDHIDTIINQGIYINESLNHMKYFFKSNGVCNLDKDGIMPKSELVLGQGTNERYYDINKCIHNPQIECKTPMTSLDKSNPSSIVKMYSVLNYLKNLGNGKMTKFVMFCAIRTKQAASDATLKTLEFAEQVSSKALSK